ncbi:hypothetical protein ACH5RR_009818 [Cinchona calisaya]|uniref:C2H2-type domain-containing protein n=1 Tax=Cinchona calisaya TaxID=153742 RepID=A0ABD3AFB6_9GENT
MEFKDGSEEVSGSADQHHSIVIKGKRTKRRQRPLSSVTSSDTLSTNSTTSTYPEDELDMANCLILLAQGDHKRCRKMEKFSRRRLFNEMAGFFMYECKTCNRSFPSFQALGGHRASHKKPKVITIEEEIKKATNIVVTPNSSNNDEEVEKEEEQEENEENGQFNRLTDPLLSTQLSTNKLLLNSNHKAAKIHGCGICGAEFSSGQALGGHMRRHRNIAVTSYSTKNSLILETSTSSTHNDHDHDDIQKPSRNIFPLDLNLPAPSDQDDLQRDLKFRFQRINNNNNILCSRPRPWWIAISDKFVDT